MPNRPGRTPASGMRTGGTIGIGGFGIGDMMSPEMNPYLNFDQETANAMASEKAGKPVNVDTQRMFSKPTFMQRLFNPTGASQAELANLEWMQRQMLSKQAFNNSMAVQKMQDEAAMARQTVGDKAALERALALETARSKAQRESNLETATFNEGIAQREAMRQANLKEDELARQERDLSAKGRAIWDSSARGELPYTLNPDVNPEDYATVARMAPAIFGKDFAESGMINQPVMASKREADIATNEATKKTALSKALSGAMTQVAPGNFAFVPGMADQPAVTGLTRAKQYVKNPITGLPEEQEITIPAGVSDSPAAIQEKNLEKKAKLDAAQAAPVQSAPVAVESERKPTPVSKRPFGTYAPPLDMEQSGLIPSMGRAITRQGQMARDVFLTPPDYMTVAGDWWKKFLFGNPAVRSKQQ